MNRGVRRMGLFEDRQDYLTFTECMAEALDLVPLDLFAFCIMPNHFHLIIRPAKDPDLTHFMSLMTMRHSKRWHRRRQSTGGGAVYQGRFRAFPIQTEGYFYAACRYVEGNALRAKLVSRAEDWPWSSLHQRVKNCHILPVETWPIPITEDWTELVNAAQKSREIGQLRRSARSNMPFGNPDWVSRTASILGVEATLRRPGPRK